MKRSELSTWFRLLPAHCFEIMSEAEGFGAITTLSGGGRYNGLVQEIGGPEMPYRFCDEY